MTAHGPSRTNRTIAAGRLAAIVVVALGFAAAARAQPADGSFWHIPPRAIAWFAFDPHALESDDRDPLVVLTKASLSGAAFDLVPFDGEGLDTARKAWTATRDKPGAVRAALLDIAGVAVPPKRGSKSVIRLDTFAAVIEGAGGAVTAFGDGAAQTWERERAIRRDEAEPWHRHRVKAAIASAGPSRGRPVLEAYVDLNALRSRVPDAFDGTALARVLRAWRLTHARSLMLHVHRVAPTEVVVRADREPDPPVYTGPSLLAVELTWESRTEPPGAVHAVTLARPEWPTGQWGIDRQPGAYAMLLRADWLKWMAAALDTYRACGTDWDAAARSTRIGAWERRHAPALSRLIASSGDWVMVWSPAPSGPDDPPSLMLVAPFKPGDDTDQLDTDARAVFNSIDDDVAWDEKGRLWSAIFARPGLKLNWLLAGTHDGRAMLAELESAPPPQEKGK